MEDVAAITGVTTELHPEDRDDDRQRDLKRDLLSPKLHIEGTTCSAAAGSPYRVEVLVNGQPAGISLQDGLGFVKINKGDTYSIRLHNLSPHDAAVRLSIDGLSVFTFSQLAEPDGTPKYRFYIVPKNSVGEIKGWHKTNSEVSSFLVTEYDKSAAASINHDQNIGTITAVFSAAWPRTGPKPADEDLTGKGLPNATGFGPPIAQVVEEVQRDVGRVRASVSLRYSK
ncbi:MAG: hypothetical protein R3C49_08540 [Planctomycetaceae bacterium]